MDGEIMSFETGEHIDAAGSSKVGTVKTTYSELVEVFGQPTFKGGDKTTSEWRISFKVYNTADDDFDYITATIYDWKMDSTPIGQHDWHVGGYDMAAAWYVQDLLDEHRG